jgi:hypothetical protein
MINERKHARRQRRHARVLYLLAVLIGFLLAGLIALPVGALLALIGPSNLASSSNQRRPPVTPLSENTGSRVR